MSHGYALLLRESPGSTRRALAKKSGATLMALTEAGSWKLVTGSW
jgi:hypothetical protein